MKEQANKKVHIFTALAKYKIPINYIKKGLTKSFF